MRVRRLHGSYFMKGSWCDTDRGRKRKGCWNVLHMTTGHGNGCGVTEGGRRGGTDEWTGVVGGWVSKGWQGRGGGEGLFNDRRVRLTVGHTLILDLQVFVGSWAGVREDI